MNATSDPPLELAFGRFRVLPEHRELLADGRPIKLGGRAFDVLMALIEARGTVVSKDALMARVWPGRVVEENNLQAQIVVLRKAFGAERDLIRTVSGRGYQFTGEVRIAAASPGEPVGVVAAPPASDRPPSNLPEASELIGREEELSEILTVERRLAAILAADVAGYSRLMGRDEEGTLSRLMAHRRELVDPKVHEHRGRIVKTTGDGMLVEFPSVVDAVRCAVEVQQGMAERNAGIPPEQRIDLRVGINLGDVMVQGDDIFGDGVNVAARLEALAEPGGIAVSRVVRDQIRDKLAYPFEDLGDLSVKNIARPVRVYALRRDAISERPASAAASVASGRQSAGAPRLSIVVLPFENLSSDPEQGYFADAITDDLTTDLSRLAPMLVISRNTASTYRNKPVDTKQIGRELGVRYVLEGSVRRLGNRVRVNAQLVDAEADAHLWVERFDRDAGDLFTLQNEITGRIAGALNLELTAREAARPTTSPGALDYILRGRAAFSKPASRDTYAEAISCYERALELAPRSAGAQALLARALAARAMDGLSDSAAGDLARAEELARQALAASWRSPLAHFARGHVLRAQGRLEGAIPEYETAIALNRNWVFASVALGACKLLTGDIEEAIALAEQAIRLSPRDPNIGILYDRIGYVHLLQSRIDEAILWCEKARSANPANPAYRAHLASAYALSGEMERAAAELAEAQRLTADGRYSSVARLMAAQYVGVPKIIELFENTFLAGLRRAGLPEE